MTAMEQLAACPGCSRHIRAEENVCPFCALALAASWSHAVVKPPLPVARLGRAALFAAGAALLVAVDGCDDDASTGDAAVDQATMADSGSGGTTGSGGAGTGGAAATGGSSGTGGAAATGGGSGTGGAAASGGRSGAGGAATGGRGGAATGGASGTGGAGGQAGAQGSGGRGITPLYGAPPAPAKK
jgi:hypothetical protein